MENINSLPEVEISTENYDIIGSGCIVLQMGENLEFRIADLKFRVEFIDEKPEGDTPLEGRIDSGVMNKGTEEAYYRIAFYNQTSAFFASASDFAHLAVIDGKPLKLKFSIQSINPRENSSDKIFFYTWYLGKEEVNPIINNVPQQ